MLGGGQVRLQVRAGRRGVREARLPRARMRVCGLGARGGCRVAPGCCKVLAQDSESVPPISWPQWASFLPRGDQINALGPPALAGLGLYGVLR